MKSLNAIMADPDKFWDMKRFHAGATYENSVKRVWDSMKGFRESLQKTGKNMWKAGKHAKKMFAAMAIYTAVSVSAETVEMAKAFGKASQEGDLTQRESVALDIALKLHEAHGNYFVTYEVVDILMNEENY